MHCSMLDIEHSIMVLPTAGIQEQGPEYTLEMANLCRVRSNHLLYELGDRVRQGYNVDRNHESSNRAASLAAHIQLSSQDGSLSIC
jgi:hypothetical protein